ncbi:class I SAM-dependent methyltransferase [Polluticaenibacter yanchengensis]|uniref:Class I SAM-dependent methyltransferase n=1 Tax=Polluticaenibacter yanchengensis TaxID=3014562 RepID=A0ABT4UN60_9BACT|nr:class I SAM-dependent methyltransferase [Chitinophagaceae bacterium LY-5]
MPIKFIMPGQMENEWFKDWFNTPYYHDLYFKRNETEANTFIRNLVSHLQLKNGARVLDLACGKGRHAVELYNQGLKVIGIDYSNYFITEAKQYENDNLHFYVQDMRQPYWINYFDVVVNLFTSFGYFKTQREHITSLNNIKNSLKAGGIFVIDYLNVIKTEKQLIKEMSITINNVDYLIKKEVTDTHFLKHIHIKDGDENFNYSESVSKFGLDDFKLMFSKVGLEIVALFGNYKLEKFDDELSDRLIIIAQKK